MKLIDPKIELWNQGNTLDEIWEHIARCARVCYQSEPRKNGETGEQFVNRVILHNHSYDEIAKDRKLQEKLHLSVLEHGTVYLKTDEPRFFDAIYMKYYSNPWSKVIQMGNYVYITTNMRVLIENGQMDALKYLCVLTKHHALRKTFSLWTNIGGIRDTNRHRVQSISEESTRYCLYSSPKFSSEIAICKLPWYTDKEYSKAEFHLEDLYNNGVINAHDTNNWEAIDWYMWYEQMCEIVYNNLHRLGQTAQQCSNVLTFSTKTQSVHTAFVDDWKHYCHLRSDEVSGKVRPEVKRIADKIKEFL